MQTSSIRSDDGSIESLPGPSPPPPRRSAGPSTLPPRRSARARKPRIFESADSSAGSASPPKKQKKQTKRIHVQEQPQKPKKGNYSIRDKCFTLLLFI